MYVQTKFYLPSVGLERYGIAGSESGLLAKYIVELFVLLLLPSKISKKCDGVNPTTILISINPISVAY